MKIEGDVDELVYLEVLPMKGLIWFDIEKEWSSKYVGPYRLEDGLKMWLMRLDFLFGLTMVYSVSIKEKLRRFFGEVGAIVLWKDVCAEKNLSKVECC